MSDPYGFKKLISDALNEQAEEFKAELSLGCSAEREEEIRAWFAPQEMRERLQKARAIREGKDPLVDLPRPGLLN